MTRRMYPLRPLAAFPFFCFLACAGMSGCHAPSPAVARVVPVVSRRTVPSAAPSPVPVQSLPLYREAEIACLHRQYRQAADLLARLATDPALTQSERAFCDEQRVICLHDAGLPAAPPHAVVGQAQNGNGQARRPAPTALSRSSLIIHNSSFSSDCGPRALLLVCKRLGVAASLPTLRQTAGTTAQGTSMAGLAQACEKLGLKAEGVQASREALGEVQLPALAWVNENHYIALLSVQGDVETGTATIADPNAAGEQTIAREQLLRLCGGYLLLVHR